MKILLVSIFSLLAVSCSFESSQFVCEADKEGTKNTQGQLCINGVWVDSNTVDKRDMGYNDTHKKTDADSKADVGPTSDADSKADLADAATCPEGEVECENECVDTMTSAMHCGGCGTTCEGGDLCNSGVCKSQCEAPTPDFCENLCVNTTSNPNYCGDCNTQCSAPTGSKAKCDSGTCGFTCKDDLADCDTLASNGCEVDLTLDPLNCGACGVPGVPEVCDLIDNDCNGVTDDGPAEICDGIDNNCDTKVDEGCPDGIVVSASDFGVHVLFGNATGGGPFSDDCPAGEALYRFSGKVEGNIDRLRGHCASLVLEIDMMVVPYGYSISRGANFDLPLHGEYNTGAYDISCPPNAFAVGLAINYSGGVHAVGLQCAELIVAENSGVYSIEYGTVSRVWVTGDNTGVDATDPLAAPAVVGSIRGRSGGFIDALGIGEKVVRLTLQ